MYGPEQQRQYYARTKEYLASAVALPAAEQLPELRSLLRYHEWRYYVQNDPVLSDYDYDQLYKQLEALEAEYPELITPDSPTQRVGSDLAPAISRAYPTWCPCSASAIATMPKTLPNSTARSSGCSIWTRTPPLVYAAEPKYDGGTIALVYENDRLVRAATRGNGVLGRRNHPQCPGHQIRSPSPPPSVDTGFTGWSYVAKSMIRKDRFVERMNAARAAAGPHAIC